MSAFIAVAKVADIPPNSRKRVEVAGKKISIFNIDDQYYTIFDICPHKKTAPLIRGTLDGIGIKCPNHGYRFDLKTGDCNIDPALKTQVFPVEVQGDDVCVRVGPIFTNLQVFYKIAQESYISMNEEIESGRRPKPGGEPGWIITYDPDQKSFKNAFITILFCGVFLESLLHLLIVDRKGINIFKKYDQKSLEDKIQLLGCDDQSIIDLCEHFRKIRREIVHEKAHLDFEEWSSAQKEATKAMGLIDKVIAHFKIEMEK